MIAVDRIIRWSTAAAVVGVAAVAAIVFCEHANALVRGAWWGGPDGSAGPADDERAVLRQLKWSCSTRRAESSRYQPPGAVVSRCEHCADARADVEHGLLGAAVAAWPTAALVGSYELLMMIIRGTQVPVEARPVAENVLDTDPPLRARFSWHHAKPRPL